MGTQIPESSRLAVKARDLNRCVRCGCPGAEWHHRRTRRVVDAHRHCPCNGVWLCHKCHTGGKDSVHGNPFEARREGFIVSRHVAEPGLLPVKAYFGSIFLHCDGTYRYEINNLKRSNEA